MEVHLLLTQYMYLRPSPSLPLLGTTYIQITTAFLVIAGMCVFSTSSALFMFPGMYLYFQPALGVYGFEKADGIGRAHDLVIQGFIRFQAISFFPVWFSTTLIYLLVRVDTSTCCTCTDYLLARVDIITCVDTMYTHAQ